MKRDRKGKVAIRKHNADGIRVRDDQSQSEFNAEGRPGFQELMKRIVENKSFSFVLAYDVTQWKQVQDTSRGRAK